MVITGVLLFFLFCFFWFVFFFRLVSGTQGRDFEIKIKRKYGEVHPERFDN